MTFVRSELPDGADVTKVSPMGRMTTYGYELGEDLIERRAATFPSGLSNTKERTGSDVSTLTRPDGTTVLTEKGPDPRFKMQSPVMIRSVERLPSGLTRTTTGARTVTLANPADIFSITSQTDTRTIDGRTWSTVYDLATRTETTTTPAGRVSRSVRDAFGNVVELQSPDTLPITLSYDVNGRLETTTQGTRVTSHAYGSDGLLAGVTDPLTQTTSFARDAKGRVTEETRPDLAVTAFGFDADDRTTSVVPPSQPAHVMSYGNIGLLASYDPPVIMTGATPTTYSYDLDKQIEQMIQPGPRTVDYAYDFAGRLETVTYPGGVVTRGYDPAGGRLATLSGPAGVSVAYEYDGSLPQSVTWTGDVSGSVAWEYDTAFRTVGETVNGANAVAFGYEADDLLIQAGGLALTRDTESGRLTGTTAGVVTDAISYSDYGEAAIYAADIGGVPTLSFAYARDELGRITSKTETLAGVSRTHDYTYDSAGRLRFVTEGASVLESYDFDQNGNRVLSANSGGTFAGTFDEQDRMLSYGDVEYTWTDNGELASKFNPDTGELTDYVYDALGNLRSVALPDATVIEYLVDGEGRRVGKVVDGVLERAWLWRAQLQPIVELDSAGTVTKRFVYAEGVNVPELMVTSAGTFRLIKDHRGSVRLVIDVTTGAITQELSYDAWGRVLVDTNPGFQPFGYSGGFHDADTGLVRFGARDYDPETGGWAAKDAPALFDTANAYAYVGGDPLNFIDARGLARDPVTGKELDPVFPGPFPPPPQPRPKCFDPDIKACKRGCDLSYAFCEVRHGADACRPAALKCLQDCVDKCRLVPTPKPPKPQCP